MRRLFLVFILFPFSYLVNAQVSQTTDHPRLMKMLGASQSIGDLLASDESLKKAFQESKQYIDPYVTRHQSDPKWIVSRLQMYWKTKSTEVFIKGGVYSHAEGEAPVPTVKFPGTRDNVTSYSAPKLDSILPYMDDPRGVFLINKTKPGKPLEWVEISKTGRTIEGINTQIMQMAHTSAILFWITKEEKYARFAFDLFDTYMTGMYYRKLPVDLTHGHHQTIVGLSTFEVIQEVAMLNQLVGTYDYLDDFLKKKATDKLELYAETFKKWADVQIENGVAFNNWDLLEAKNILNIALILDDNSKYKDGKGQQYYTDLVLNKNFERQWSITKVVKEGYDQENGLWNECPGYSLNVLNDFTGFVSYFDKYFNKDILPQMPVLSKSVTTIAQYLFPNGYITAFGDSYYRRLATGAAEELVINAQKNNKTEQEESLTRFVKTISTFNKNTGGTDDKADSHGSTQGLPALLAGQSKVKLNESTETGKIEEYVTPVFYSPKVSYLALRNGLDAKNGLMVAMSGSKGNHMHAGGISMEIFGKGIVLGPESGIGTSYFQQDYAEYYSQFPAHNTVAVDGISAYPVMKSNHGFDLLSSYPASGLNKGFFDKVSYADMFFVEPETMSDQNRLISIIKTSDSFGYYVDIFRSRRRDGKDKMHDYFYHNIGQKMTISDSSGRELDLKPTNKLSFSGGHLFAYDYFWDKKSIGTTSDFTTTFTLSIPGREDVMMNLWMKGAPDREIFSVKAPPSKAIGRGGMIPDSIAKLPMPTLIARQSGEAWKRPFVAVYQPFTSSESHSVLSIKSFVPSIPLDEFVGVEVATKTGSKDFIFSSTDSSKDIVYADKGFKGTFGVIRENGHSTDLLFLGNGSMISKGGFSITTKSDSTSAALSKQKDGWYVTSSKPVTVTFPANELKGAINLVLNTEQKKLTIKGKKESLNGVKVLSFEMPEIAYSKVEF